MKKRKITFMFVMAFVIGIIVYKDPIISFAADFYQGNMTNSNTGDCGVDSDIRIMKKGKRYTFAGLTGSGGYSLTFHTSNGDYTTSGYFSDKTTTSEIYPYNNCYTQYIEGKFDFTVPNSAGNYNYWKVTNKGVQNYTYLFLTLEPFDYAAPTFDLSCNPSEIALGEESTCTLKASAVLNLQNVSFKLQPKGYSVSNVKEGSSFKTITNSNGTYILEEKDNATTVSSLTDIELVTFKIKSETSGVSDPRITIADLAYNDGVNETSQSESEDVIAEIKDTTSTTSNPSTGMGIIYSFIALVIISFVIGLSSYIMSKKKLDSQI